MRILIDLQGAQSPSRLRGIGRYTTSLAKAMISVGRQHEFFLLLNGMLHESIPEVRAAFEGILPRERMLIWHSTGPVDWLSEDNKTRRTVAELIREAFIAYLAPDVVHVSCVTDGFGDATTCTIGAPGTRPPTAITFYDVIPLVQSDVYLRPNPTFEKMYRERLKQMSAADAFLAISEHARSEAVTYLGVEASRTHNISADTDPTFRKVRVRRWAERQLRAKFGLGRPFIMYSGATDERKNHLRLIAAFSMLPTGVRTRHQLVFVGRTPQQHIEKFRRYAKALGVSELEFVIAGAVTDEELLLFYNLCALFVMPSWHEGFGLPALEAMRCGAPVIGSSSTSIPEVIGDPSALFDPFSARSMSTKMAEVLSTPTFRQALAANGAARARMFSWERCARTAIAAMEGMPLRNAAPYDPSVVDSLIAKLGAALPSSIDDSFLRQIARHIDRTFVKPRQRQLLVDISELVRTDAGTGIQRVVRNIMRQLLTAPPESFAVIPVYAVDEAGWYRYAKRYGRRALGLVDAFFDGDDTDVELRAGDIFIGLDLHHRTPPRHLNISDRLRAVGGYSYFVVYDLLPVAMPQNFPDAVAPRHIEWLLGVANSDGAICISRSVADDFIAWLPGSGSPRKWSVNVGWFHLGFDLAVESAAVAAPADRDDTLLDTMAQRPSFLMVGTLEPRKGHLQTLIAFDQLWDEGHDLNLVIVGKHGWNVDLQAELIRTHAKFGHRLFWKESASDGLLTLIYDQASCLIAASEGEGFGLPLVEAAERGVDIIARDIPVFREVAADYASFFSGENGESIAAAVSNWLNGTGRRHAERISSGQRITWQESKNQLMQCVLHGGWYWSGERAGARAAIRLVGSDYRFQSVVGRRIGTSMHSTHQSGYLMFGYYMSLPAGVYAAELEVEFVARGHFRADVTSGRGENVLVIEERAGASRGNGTIRLAFSLSAPAEDVEVRLHLDKDIGIVVRSLNVGLRDQRPAYDEWQDEASSLVLEA